MGAFCYNILTLLSTFYIVLTLFVIIGAPIQKFLPIPDLFLNFTDANTDIGT